MNESRDLKTEQFRSIMLQKISMLVQIEVHTQQGLMDAIGNLSDHQLVAMTVSCPTIYETPVQANGYDMYIDPQSQAVAFFGIVEGSQDYVVSVYCADESNPFPPVTFITREPTMITIQTPEGERQLFASMDEEIMLYDEADLETLLDILHTANSVLETHVNQRLNTLKKD